MRKYIVRIAYLLSFCLLLGVLTGCNRAAQRPSEGGETVSEMMPADHTQVHPIERPTMEVEADWDRVPTQDITEKDSDQKDPNQKNPNSETGTPAKETTGSEPEAETDERTEIAEKIESETVPETTQMPTTQAPTTQAPTTQAPTTEAPTTQAPTQSATIADNIADNNIDNNSNNNTQKPQFDPGSNKDVYEKAVALTEKYTQRYQTMLDRINALREQAGVGPLVLDTKLCYAATMRAVEMDYGNYLDHRRYNGASSFTTIKYVGVEYMACGENIARGCTNTKQAYEAWKNSQVHRDILVSDKYKKVGVGYCNEKGTLVWALQFTD